MSVVTITKTTCDRCGHDESQEQGDFPEWGNIVAGRRAQHGPRIGALDAGRFGDDLCPGCITDLFAWWSNRTSPSPQPAPPPAPARAAFTLLDRKAAIAATVKALHAHTQFVLGVVREEPTSILSGDVVPGALLKIDVCGADIVDDVVRLLHLSAGIDA